MNSTTGKRTALAALAMLCCAAAIAGVAGAIASSNEPAARKAEADKHRLPGIDAAALRKFLRNPVPRGLTAADHTPAPVPPPSTPRSRKPQREKVVTATVAGKAGYTTVLSFPTGGDDYSIAAAGTRVKIIRTDLATGVRTVVFRGKNMYATAYAAPGRVWINSIALKRSAQLKIVSRLLTMADGETTPTQVKTGQITVEPTDDGAVCGDFFAVLAANPNGEALTGRVTGSCGGPEQITAALEGMTTAGVTREIIKNPTLENLILRSAAKFTGDRVFRGGGQADYYFNSPSVTDATTGKSTVFWDRGYQSVSDMADDGTVAVVAGHYDDYEDDFNAPLLLFPGGNIDAPQIRLTSTPLTTALQFCGARLFELRAQSRRYATLNSYGYYDDYYYDLLYQRKRLLPKRAVPKVIVRDASATQLRDAGRTSRRGVVARGCDGNALLLGSVKGERLSVQRIEP